jgi:hypothetical protein
MGGPLAGFSLLLVGSAAWAIFVLVRSWIDGDLARPFPNYDPCGFVGYAGRMLIVSGLFLGRSVSPRLLPVVGR